MIYAYLETRQGEQVSELVKIDHDGEFDYLEQMAEELGRICCIRWKRDTDGQQAYWTPKGAAFEPHWYNAGQPKKPDHLRKTPVTVKLPGWLNDWLGEQDEAKAVLIEQALITQHGLTPPKS